MKPKGKPDAELYAIRKEALGLLEGQAEAGNIALYYGDETRISEQGYVPYGWQFAGEEVAIEVCRGKSINCFGLLSRDNEFMFKNTIKNIDADFILETLEELSWRISTLTVVVLDNARAHTALKIKERLVYWQKRGLYIFYLPPYSPQLNIIERLWKEFKEGWLKPHDYQTADTLFYAVNRICVAIQRKQLTINFDQGNNIN